MKKTVLITGASGGIGAEFARIFAREGYALVLVARGKEALEKLAHECKKLYDTETHILIKDLSDAKSPEEIFHELQKKELHIDVLVNNAGYGLFGMFTEIEMADQVNMMELNMVALTKLAKLFLPPMLKKKSGKILNVASTAAFQPGPLMAVYYATKAYVLSLSEALANELRGTGVTVTALCPGPTKTGFSGRADLGKSNLFRGKIMDATSVAETGYKALMKGKELVIPGFKNRLFAFAVRLTPRKLVTKLVRKIQSPL